MIILVLIMFELLKISTTVGGVGIGSGDGESCKQLGKYRQNLFYKIKLTVLFFERK